MGSIFKSEPQHDVSAAIAAMEKILIPSDIINLDGYDPWYKPWAFIPHGAIRLHQKKLFGKTSNYRDTHTVLYFEPEKIFSVTTPRTRWETIEHNAKGRFTIYRYQPYQFDDTDIAVMLEAANKMIGTKYDYGQLLDIALNHILGYEHIRKAKIFDLGKRRLVCSVGARALYEQVRYRARWSLGYDKIDRLFNELNPDYWPKHEVEKFQRSDVELTSPAHFANSHYFKGEFKPVLSWREFL